MSDLIYDIGMHDGDDSDFYLRKGFRVVAVEADPELCEQASRRFASEIAEGRITIVNRAIAPVAGPVTFYRSTIPGWGTVVESWNTDNAVRGVAAEALVVEGITLADLVEEHGDAFYMKVDIEGMDHIALEGLASTFARPRYLSMETSFARSPAITSIEQDFAMLTRFGYDHFKIVDQAAVPQQVPPSPALVGKYVAHAFSDGSSGLFGEESPGEWQSAQDALESFRQTCRKKRLRLLLYRNTLIYLYYSRVMQRLAGGEPPNLSWYDIHAKHGSVD